MTSGYADMGALKRGHACRLVPNNFCFVLGFGLLCNKCFILTLSWPQIAAVCMELCHSLHYNYNEGTEMYMCTFHVIHVICQKNKSYI